MGFDSSVSHIKINACNGLLLLLLLFVESCFDLTTRENAFRRGTTSCILHKLRHNTAIARLWFTPLSHLFCQLRTITFTSLILQKLRLLPLLTIPNRERILIGSHYRRSRLWWPVRLTWIFGTIKGTRRFMLPRGMGISKSLRSVTCCYVVYNCFGMSYACVAFFFM